MRLLHIRVPARRLIAIERDHPVRHGVRDEAPGRIRVRCIRHLRIPAVKGVRSKARPCTEQLGTCRHRIAQHLHDRLTAACLRCPLQNLLNPYFCECRRLVRLFITRLNRRGNLPQFVKALRLLLILKRIIGHLSYDTKDNRHHNDNTDYHNAVDLKADPPPLCAALRLHPR